MLCCLGGGEPTADGETAAKHRNCLHFLAAAHDARLRAPYILCRMKLTMACVMTLCLATPVWAEIISIQPPAPTSADVISVEVVVPNDDFEFESAVISGSEIRVRFRGAGNTTSTSRKVGQFGPLPAGVYSLIVVYVYEDLNENVYEVQEDPPVALLIQPAPIPVMDGYGVAILATILAVAGVFAMRRL